VSKVSFAAVAPGNLAVVTGAASGIGLAAAPAFAVAEMRVVLVDLPGAVSEDSAASIDGGVACAADVADRAAVQPCSRAAVDGLARTLAECHRLVSVLMNAAGIGSGGDVLAGPCSMGGGHRN
jgi:NAD(P)-dependent dehydrogenase (short-subunit alcohol dehydrogenase family)